MLNLVENINETKATIIDDDGTLKYVDEGQLEYVMPQLYSPDQPMSQFSVEEMLAITAKADRAKNAADWARYAAKADADWAVRKPVYLPKRSGGSRRRRPSRKYKKSAKRVFRKKSRSTRRR